MISNASSSSVLPQESTTDEYSAALEFVEKVRATLGRNSVAFEAFTDVLISAKKTNANLSADQISSQIQRILYGYDDLITQFHFIVPAERAVSDDTDEVKGDFRSQALRFCAKVKGFLDNNPVLYEQFLRILHSYTLDVISEWELRDSVADFLGKKNVLLSEFDDLMIHYQKNANGTLDSNSTGETSESRKVPKKRKRMRNCDDEDDEVDLSKCEQCTPSYWRLPKKYRKLNASNARSEYLNDEFVSRDPSTVHPITLGENEGEQELPKTLGKNEHEKIISDCEDQRFECDMLISYFKSTADACTELLKVVRIRGESSTIDVNKYLSVRHRNCIEKLYGEYGSDLLAALEENPANVLPVIETRVINKHKELENAKAEMNKKWARVYAEHQGKSQSICKTPSPFT